MRLNLMKKKNYVNGCFCEGSDIEMILGTNFYKTIRNFYVGYDDQAAVMRMNIYIDPFKYKTDMENCKENDIVGLINLVSLKFKGRYFPPEIFNENLAYLQTLCGNFGEAIIWPQIIDTPYLFREEFGPRIDFPCFALNTLLREKPPSVTHYDQNSEYYPCGLFVQMKEEYQNNESLCASAAIPIGIDYDGITREQVAGIFDEYFNEGVEPYRHIHGNEEEIKLQMDMGNIKNMLDIALYVMDFDKQSFIKIYAFTDIFLFRGITEENFSYYFCAAGINKEETGPGTDSLVIYKLEPDTLDEIIETHTNTFLERFENYLSIKGAESYKSESESLDVKPEGDMRLNNAELEMDCLTIAMKQDEEKNLAVSSGITWGASRRFDSGLNQFTDTEIKLPRHRDISYCTSVLEETKCIEKYKEYRKHITNPVTGHEMWFVRE